MINKIKNMNKLTLYFICILFVYIILILLNYFFENKENIYTVKNYEYKMNHIEENTEIYSIDVYYPRYSSDEVSSLITNYIYNYITTFKKKSENTNKKETLKINYEIQKINDYTNILFVIDNSLVQGEKYKSILIDTKNEKEIFINSLYGNNILTEIKDMFYKKYSESIYKNIKDLTLKDFNFSFKDSFINVYVNKNLISSNILYDIYVSKIINEEKYVFEEALADKYVAFTFDDGPSEYTTDIVDAFVSNNSKATFFMLGNRMKAMGSVVNYVNDNGMEIGSHTYSHKRLTDLSKEEALEEINSTVIVYNEITKDNLTLLRPPYGAINDELMNISLFPLITWSVDPKDWLNRDAENIKNHILETIYDGAIILMHDIYPTSKEAIKMLIPELINMGYKLVTVSELAEIKGKKLIPGQIVREIK